jgi:hypothetical protein
MTCTWETSGFRIPCTYTETMASDICRGPATLRLSRRERVSSPSMQPFVAAGAQGNEVQIVIRALLTAQLLVVDLQVLFGTTDLALPAISL